MKKKKYNRAEIEAKINVHAWKNPEFKKKLIADPRAALKEMDVNDIPADIELKVVQEDKDQWCIVLRCPPEGTSAQAAQDSVENSNTVHFPCKDTYHYTCKDNSFCEPVSDK